MNLRPRKKPAPSRSSSHRRDYYFDAARACGYRARSAFKLQQIDQKHRLIRPNMRIVELGCAPGGWSQYAQSRLGARDAIIGVDMRATEPLAKLHFICGDFTEPAVIAQIVDALDGRKADLVLSDMAPNISGVRDADQAHGARLQRALAEFCAQQLRDGGVLLTKLFGGDLAPAMRAMFAAHFNEVRQLKPDASRARSKEVYLLARGHRAQTT